MKKCARLDELDENLGLTLRRLWVPRLLTYIPYSINLIGGKAHDLTLAPLGLPELPKSIIL